MPTVYLLALCRSSAMDQLTNTASVFHLLEQVNLEKVPATLPIEVHLYAEFEEAERGRPYDVRFVVRREDGTAEVTSAPVKITSPTRRHRLITHGMQVAAHGYHYLVAQMRPEGGGDEAWEESPLRWPVDVSRLEQEERSR